MFPNFLTEEVEVVAQKLLGCFLEAIVEKHKVIVRIVETEAYDQDDPASHAFLGKTARNNVMFGKNGHLYVYFTYGMHYCCNITTGRVGYGSGVLIRSVEPVAGKELLEERRGIVGKNATNGPAKLCKALGIDQKLNGHDLRKSSLKLIEGSLLPGEKIRQTTRIGISKATDRMRRYYIDGNLYVSKK